MIQGGMNRTGLIALGVLVTVIFSLLGMVLVPDAQLRMLGPVTAEVNGEAVTHPLMPTDEVLAGQRVYRDLGCIYCHSQQVRPGGYGADRERGWGARRSVPRDYRYQGGTLLGTMRTGPDLATIGQRQPSERWHYLHLYDPRITSPGSIMPPFTFLFDTRPANDLEGADIPGNAIRLPDAFADEPTVIVPRPRARELVAYLLSLQQPLELEEVR